MNAVNAGASADAGALAAFEEHRGLLFSIAYRMLGSRADAEDMLQETLLRWQQASDAAIRDSRAFLVTVITRLCINQLQSARVKREQYFGQWLPEPLFTQSAAEPAAISGIDPRALRRPGGHCFHRSRWDHYGAGRLRGPSSFLRDSRFGFAVFLTMAPGGTIYADDRGLRRHGRPDSWLSIGSLHRQGPAAYSGDDSSDSGDRCYPPRIRMAQTQSNGPCMERPP